jgi:hypothetical protein
MLYIFTIQSFGLIGLGADERFGLCALLAVSFMPVLRRCHQATVRRRKWPFSTEEFIALRHLEISSSSDDTGITDPRVADGNDPCPAWRMLPEPRKRSPGILTVFG